MIIGPLQPSSNLTLFKPATLPETPPERRPRPDSPPQQDAPEEPRTSFEEELILQELEISLNAHGFLNYHLERFRTDLDDANKRTERTFSRLRDILFKVQKGQEESLAALKNSLADLVNLKIVPARSVQGDERDSVLRSLREIHGPQLSPDDAPYRLYREDTATSYLMLNDGRVLAQEDGTIGSSEDKDELMLLVQNALSAREALLTQAFDDMRADLDASKYKFLGQFSAVLATLKMFST